MSDIVIRPIERIKKKCLCCGEEMEIFPYTEQDFCNRCFPIVCREVFAKEMGIEIDKLSYIECTIDLKKEE